MKMLFYGGRLDKQFMAVPKYIYEYIDTPEPTPEQIKSIELPKREMYNRQSFIYKGKRHEVFICALISLKDPVVAGRVLLAVSEIMIKEGIIKI